MLRSAPLPTPLMSTSSLESVEEADARMWRDKAFARFKSEAEAVLLHFERAQEWADLIADLLKLQRVLNKYPQFNVVPDKVLVAKRLYQCLNSALPAGVHLKTLETFELIFSRIGVERLARDLAFYSEGIFPLYRYAAFQVKPVLLDLFERHYVPLGPRVVPCLPGLVPALLLAMDDVGADRLSQRALSLLDALASCTPIAAFMAAVWGCLLHNSAVRLQALHYITTRFPTPGADADDGAGGLGETSKGVATTSSARLAVPPELFCPDAEGTVLRSLVVALQRGDSLVRRTALELLVNHFPLPAPEGAASAAHAAAAAAGDDDGDDPAADPAAAAAAALFDASGESPIKSGLAAADVLFGRGGSAIFGAPSAAPAAAAAAAPAADAPKDEDAPADKDGDVDMDDAAPK